MRDKKVIILIVLSIFAVISVIYGITAPSKYKKSGAIRISPNKPVGAQAAVHASMERRAKRSRFKSWKRNPFVPGEREASSTLVLSGIIWNKEKPKAMIGEMIVGKGEKIRNVTVVDIMPDKVILNDGTKDFELKLEK